MGLFILITLISQVSSYTSTYKKFREGAVLCSDTIEIRCYILRAGSGCELLLPNSHTSTMFCELDSEFFSGILGVFLLP